MKREWFKSSVDTTYTFHAEKMFYFKVNGPAVTVDYYWAGGTASWAFANNAAALAYLDDIKSFLDRQQQLETITP